MRRTSAHTASLEKALFRLSLTASLAFVFPPSLASPRLNSPCRPSLRLASPRHADLRLAAPLLRYTTTAAIRVFALGSRRSKLGHGAHGHLILFDKHFCFLGCALTEPSRAEPSGAHLPLRSD